MQFRIGHGFDVHRLEEHQNATIFLCGVGIPSKYRVIAHSDGDVALHALMDAILGAMALGDIGIHFPPNDDKWKNADSKHLLKIVDSLLKENKATINNIDITIIAEYPKISPYRTQMIHKIAEVLQLEYNKINIKATTTERLGFTGRKEGIAAQAVCSVLA